MGKPGLALPHIKASMKYDQKGSFGPTTKEAFLADIYSSLGKFELRDYHRLRSLEIADIYFSKPRSYRWNTDEFSEVQAYSTILNLRMYDLSWAENAKDNLLQMHRLWKRLEALNSRWVNNETKYMIYTRVSYLFAEAGDISFAWTLHNRAQELVNTHCDDYEKQGLSDLKLNEARILKCEGNYKRAATLIEKWMEDYHWAYNKPPGVNAYTVAGIIQEYAGNYDKAISYLEKGIANIEIMRTSFEVQMRESLIGGLTVKPYWSLIRSYARRYREKGKEEDFMGALRSARMLRSRQFGELLGIEYKAGEDLDLASLRLNPNELLLNIILTDRAMITFAISSKRHELLLAPYESRTFNAMVKSLKEELSQPGDSNAYLSDLLQISKLVVIPVKDMLANSKKVIVMPDGVLNGISFTTLSTSATSYMPMIMEHEVVLTPSISCFIEQQEGQYKNRSDTLFALADPVYGDRQTPVIH